MNGRVRTGSGNEPDGLFESDELEDAEGAIGKFENVTDAEGVGGIAKLIEKSVSAGGFGFASEFVIALLHYGGTGGVGGETELGGCLFADPVNLEDRHQKQVSMGKRTSPCAQPIVRTAAPR